MGINQDVEIGFELPPLTKQMTQDAINKFEACGIVDRPNIHNDPEAAKAAGIGSSPIASGRMTTAFVSEAMREFFGAGWGRSGKTDLNFIRPVRDGDSITVRATVKDKVVEGKKTRIVFDVYAENQNGDKTAVGSASALA